MFDDQQKLEALAQELKNLGLMTKIEGNTLFFEGKNISPQTLEKVLQIFNLEIKVNKAPTPLNQQIFF